MTASGEERRRFPRLDIRIFNISLMVKPFLGEPIEIYPRDLSIGGISFKTDVALTRGDHLRLTIGLPMTPLPEQVSAQTAWVHISDDFSDGGRVWYDVGVTFLDISDNCREDLQTMIGNEIKRQSKT